MGSWLGRDLSEIDLRPCLMIDGVRVDDHVLLVALGIDADGQKYVLGVREGATESASACTDLLTDLRDRAMRTRPHHAPGVGSAQRRWRRRYGRSLAPRHSSSARWAHKVRNVLDQLPDHLRTSVRAAMREAYGCTDAPAGRRNCSRTYGSEGCAPPTPEQLLLWRKGIEEDPYRDASGPTEEPRADALHHQCHRKPHRLRAQTQQAASDGGEAAR